MLHRIQLD